MYYDLRNKIKEQLAKFKKTHCLITLIHNSNNFSNSTIAKILTKKEIIDNDNEFDKFIDNLINYFFDVDVNDIEIEFSCPDIVYITINACNYCDEKQQCEQCEQFSEIPECAFELYTLEIQNNWNEEDATCFDFLGNTLIYIYNEKTKTFKKLEDWNPLPKLCKLIDMLL